MTQLEQFREMLKGTGSEQKKFHDGDYGENVSIVFQIEAGIGGSHTTYAEAFFKKDTGKFIGINHCD